MYLGNYNNLIANSIKLLTGTMNVLQSWPNYIMKYGLILLFHIFVCRTSVILTSWANLLWAVLNVKSLRNPIKTSLYIISVYNSSLWIMFCYVNFDSFTHFTNWISEKIKWTVIIMWISANFELFNSLKYNIYRVTFIFYQLILDSDDYCFSYWN